MISAYADLIPSMNVRLPDCSPEMIEQALWIAGREFCLESEAYIVEDTSNGVADQKEYSVLVPNDFDPIRIFDVRRRSEDEVTNGEKGTIISSSEYDFHILDPLLPHPLFAIEFFAAPFSENITDGLVVRVVVAPFEDENDTQLDFDWVRRWARYVKAGAFYHLFSMPNAPWSSEAEAARWFQEFRKGVAYARREVKIQGTTRQLRIAGGNFL